MEATPLQSVTGQARTGAKMDNRENLKGFMGLLIVTQVIGLVAVVLVATWTVHYRGGFAWRSNPSLEFNWHPLLMTVGMVFLFANSILIYRSLRNLRKKQLKLIHAGIHFTVVILVLISSIAVLDSHNLASPPIPNLYSLHSWVGATAVTIFILQWIVGFLAFLYPGFPNSLRASIMPVHVFLGLFAFICAIAAALMGITEKTLFSLGSKYSDFPGEGILVNFIGMFFVVFAALVVYIATEPKFKRYPRPEDGALLTGTAE